MPTLLIKDLQGEDTQGTSQEQRVKNIRSFIRQQQQVYRGSRTPQEREEIWPPEEIIRHNLEWQSGSSNEEKGEFFFTLRMAWDALAYERYKIGSREESLAGSGLQAYCSSTREPTIKLSDIRQVKMLDALTEAVDIPHQKGQTEIKIPEKLRKYNKLLMSAEYQEQWEKAQTNRKK